MLRDTPPRPIPRPMKDQNAELAGHATGSIINIVVKDRCKGPKPSFSRSLDVSCEGREGTHTPNGISPLQQSRGLEGENALSVQTGRNISSMLCDPLESPQLGVYGGSMMAPKPMRIMSPRVLNSDAWGYSPSYDIGNQYASSDDTSSSDTGTSEPTSRDSDVGMGVESMFNLYQQHDLGPSDWLENGHPSFDEQTTSRRCSNPLHQALDSIQSE